MRRRRTSARRRRAPGPNGARIAWQLLTRHNLLDVLEEYSSYGDVVRWRILGRPFYSLRDPEHLRHVLIANQDNYRKSFQYRLLAIGMGEGLLTNDGPTWARQRRLIQPMFAKRHLGRFAEHMTAAIGDFLTEWERRPDGDEVGIGAAMNGLALDVVGRALFGTRLSGRASGMRPAVLTGLRSGVVAARLQLVVAAPRPLIDLAGWLLYHAPVLPPTVRRIRDALLGIDRVVQELIAAREADPDADPGDLLGLLLAARDEDGRPMDRRQVRDELITFLLAGHETTANGLAWMWCLLAQNPEARARLVAEVDEVLGDRVPTAEDAERLTWTAACFQEALRLYSPVWIFEREAIGDDEIGGRRIPAGSTILIPTHLIHRNPAVWPDPERFDPGRFVGARAHEHPRCAYLPFGAGRRICIGAGFAVLEATLIAAMVAQRYELDLAPGATVAPETTITLRPRRGLRMTLRRRAPRPALSAPA